LLDYCRENDWAGHDPYDALNSRFLEFLPILNFRLSRIALTQILKRSPCNVRRLLWIPKTRNPKALALFLDSLLKLDQLGLIDEPELAQGLVERLVALRSPESAHWCWGYSFPWQTRTLIVPRAAPSLVCTTFVGNALLNAFEYCGDDRCRQMALSAADYILKELYWTDGDAAGFRYPTPTSTLRVHNANFLGAAFLARAYRHGGEERMVEAALRAARYSAGGQQADGSWFYGELRTQRWIDNFHTGYNLCALRTIDRALDTAEFEPAVRRGYAFYVDHFFSRGWRCEVFSRPRLSGGRPLRRAEPDYVGGIPGPARRQPRIGPAGIGLGAGPHVGPAWFLLLPRPPVLDDQGLPTCGGCRPGCCWL